MEIKNCLITLYALITESVTPYKVSDKSVNDITSTDKNFYVYNLSSFREGGKVGQRVDFGSILMECKTGERNVLLGFEDMNVVGYYNNLRESIRSISKYKPYTLSAIIDDDTAKRLVDLIIHLNYTMMSIYMSVSKNTVWYSDVNISRALDMVYTTLSKLIKIIEVVYDLRRRTYTVAPSSNRPRVTSLRGKLEDHLSTFPLIKDILKNIKDTPLDDMVMEAITIYEKHGDKAYAGTLSVLTAYRQYIMSIVEDELNKDLTELSIISNTINRYNSLKGIK